MEVGDWLPYALVFAFILIAAGAAFWNHLREKKRTESLAEVARQLGLEFRERGCAALLSQLAGFQLFSQGRSRKMRNRILANTDDVELTIFDYEYTTGTRKNSRTWRQTVVCFEGSESVFPQFSLRPERLLDKVGSALGFQDIDFDTHPKFSKNYLLRGSPEERIREVFNEDVLSFFETKSDVSVEAQGQLLVLFRRNGRVKPHEIRSLMEEGFTAFRLLRSACALEPAGALS